MEGGLSLEADQYSVFYSKVATVGGYVISLGDGLNSYLVRKIKGTASGSRMPPQAPYLSQAEVDKIILWIDAGAVRGSTAVEEAAPAPSIVSSWYGIQRAVLGPKCVTCHGGASPTMGVSWEADRYETIVTNSQTSSTGVPLIAPVNSAGSYLYQKLMGTASGSRMPLTGGYLSQATINIIAAWIDAGAPLGNPTDGQ